MMKLFIKFLILVGLIFSSSYSYSVKITNPYTGESVIETDYEDYDNPDYYHETAGESVIETDYEDYDNPDYYHETAGAIGIEIIMRKDWNQVKTELLDAIKKYEKNDCDDYINLAVNSTLRRVCL